MLALSATSDKLQKASSAARLQQSLSHTASPSKSKSAELSGDVTAATESSLRVHESGAADLAQDDATEMADLSPNDMTELADAESLREKSDLEQVESESVPVTLHHQLVEYLRLKAGASGRAEYLKFEGMNQVVFSLPDAGE